MEIFLNWKSINVSVMVETSSADNRAPETCKTNLCLIVDEGCYTAYQVYNADETGMHWKKVPSKTYLMKDKAKAVGFKLKPHA